MKKTKKIAKAAALSAALALLLLVSTSAATWDEMRKNGVVSDVSETTRVGNGITSGIANGIDRAEDGIERIGEDIMGSGGTTARGNAAMPDQTGTATNDGIVSGSDTSGTLTSEPASTTKPTTTASTTAPATTNNHAANGEKDGGMTAGIIIAMLVVAAVVVIIFLLIPKRRH